MLRNKLNVRNNFFTKVQHGGAKITPYEYLESVYPEVPTGELNRLYRRGVKTAKTRVNKAEKKKEKDEKKAEKKAERKRAKEEEWQKNIEEHNKRIAEKKAEKDEKKREKKRENKREARTRELIDDILERADKQDRDEKEGKRIDAPARRARAPAAGLARWQAHVKAYKQANPGVPHRQAVQDAKATYRKAGDPVEKKAEKKQEKKAEAKAEKKAEAKARTPAAGLARWQAHLKAYKQANPGVPHKQAMQNAKATYTKAGDRKQEKEKDEKDSKEDKKDSKEVRRHEKDEQDDDEDESQIYKKYKTDKYKSSSTKSKEQGMQPSTRIMSDKNLRKLNKQKKREKAIEGTYFWGEDDSRLINKQLELMAIDKKIMKLEQLNKIDDDITALEQTTKAQEEELAIKQSQLQDIENKIIGYNNKLLINEKIPTMEQTISTQEDELAYGQSQLQRMENKVMKYKQLMKEQYEEDREQRFNEQKERLVDFSKTNLIDRKNRALEKLDLDIKLAKVELEIEKTQQRNVSQILRADYTKQKINRELREMDTPVVLKRSTTRKEKLQTPRDIVLLEFKQKALEKERERLRRIEQIEQDRINEIKRIETEKYEMDSLERLEEQKRRALDFSNTYLLDRQRSALNSLDIDIKLAKIELEIKEKQERNRKQILTADYTKTRINRELREMDPPVVLKRSTTRKGKLQTPRDALLSAFAKKARQKKAKALADKYLYGNLAQFEKEEAEEERDKKHDEARSDIIRRAGAYAVENNITYAEALRMLS